MDRALYIAMSGAKQNTLSQTAHSNNLANVSTTGFRADFEHARSMPVFGEHYPSRAYAMSERPSSDFRPGTLITTERNLDIALNQQGWFAVVGPDGNEAYTRRGDLRVDELGRLVNGEGRQLINAGGAPIIIPPYETIDVARDGTISIQPAGAGPAAVAAIDEVKRVNPEVGSVEKGEDGLFRLREAEPGAVADNDPNVVVLSGHLEHSNVNVVHSLTNIISLHRQYEMQVKLMSTVDENAAATTRILEIQ